MSQAPPDGGFFPLVYDELRRLAAAKLAGEPAGHTLDATALVHEAYLRLGDAAFGGRSESSPDPTGGARRVTISGSVISDWLRLRRPGSRQSRKPHPEAVAMPLDPRRVKVLFTSALDLPGPGDRPAFLDRECGQDQELRRRLVDLLAAHDRPDHALERPLAAGPGDATSVLSDPDQPGATADRPGPDAERTDPAPAPPEASPTASVIGSVIAGRYKVREEIGEGGMGSVYLADQTHPVRRRVALKLIKPGMDSRTVLARFESERQALALMDHPHIAKVLDAGSTEAGRPFFVMELVKGVPLNGYCDQHRLGLPERLALFRQICSAVQHAHQKGIIHRDLKPTNILVESHDGKPVPKVIDFGLAKATSGMQLGEQSLYTAFGTVTGTPLYMAPEQATFNALDVDTRADIYALGVILYELLAGSTPIRRDTMQRAGLEEMLRVIREVEPPTPSSRISTSDGLPGLAAARHIEASRLSRFVRGDLDWIVMKALAKERHRRYDSAIGLANDIERFTNHEPVSAGPPTAGYRLRKFARRNRGRVVAGSLVLVALVLGVVGTSIGLIEARRQKAVALAEAGEKEAARQVAERRLAQVAKINEILGSIFADLDPHRAAKEGKPLAAVLGERLDQATEQIEGEAIGDRMSVASMQVTLGRSQLGLGYPEKAIGLFTRARATFTSRLGPGNPQTLVAMGNLATAYRLAGRHDRAVPLHEQTLALWKARLGPGYPSTLYAMGKLATAYMAAGRLDRAVPLHEETLALMRDKLGPGNPQTLAAMDNLATAYQLAGRLDRAVPLHEEALALRKAKLGPGHPDTLNAMGHLASAYRAAGRLDRAVPLHEEALALKRAKLGPGHPDTLIAMNNLATAYADAGRPERAVPLHEEALALMRDKLGPDHPNTLTAMGNLANAYQADDRLDESLPLFREMVERQRRVAGPDSPLYATALAQLGLHFLRREAWADAEPILREASAIREATKPDDWSTFNARSMLGGALLGQERYTEAGPLLRAGYEGMKGRADRIASNGKARVGEAIDRLIELAEATNKPDDLKMWKDERAKWPAAPAPKPGPKAP